MLATEDGAPVSWKSTTNRTCHANENFNDLVAPGLSSGENEIYAVSEATKHFLHLSYIAKELNLPGWPTPIPIGVDATVALAFMEDSCNKSRMKHIDLRQSWVSIVRDSSQVIGIKVPTNLNDADLGTKLMAPHQFEPIRDRLYKPISIPK